MGLKKYTIGGVEYDPTHPELKAIISDISAAEKNKIRSTIEAVKATVASLPTEQSLLEEAERRVKEQIPNNTLESQQMNQPTVPTAPVTPTPAMQVPEELTQAVKAISDAATLMANSSKQQEQQGLQAYREQLLKQNEGLCIPEYVVGNTREQLDASLQQSIKVRASFAPAQTPAPQTPPAAPTTPVVTTPAPTTPPATTPVVTTTPTTPVTPATPPAVAPSRVLQEFVAGANGQQIAVATVSIFPDGSMSTQYNTETPEGLAHYQKASAAPVVVPTQTTPAPVVPTNPLPTNPIITIPGSNGFPVTTPTLPNLQNVATMSMADYAKQRESLLGQIASIQV